MIAMANSPWGKLPLDNSSRGVPARTVAPLQSLCVGGATFSFPAASPSGRGRAGLCPAYPADPIPARDPGLTKDAGGAPEADSHRASGAALCLRLTAAHHGCSVAQAVEHAAAHYCETVVGLQRMADINDHCRGRAAAARQPHKLEVAGSIPPPQPPTPVRASRVGRRRPWAPADASRRRERMCPRVFMPAL